MRIFISLLTFLLLSLPSGAETRRAQVFTQSGTATYYGIGKWTASGERFNPAAYTAAHRTLPFGSLVHVVNRTNGRSVIVRITDRGPEAWTGRIIDVTPAAARALDMISAGVAQVQLEILQ